MKWLLKLYPREWQRHYGAEIAEVVDSQPGSFQLAIDLLGGAIDAHLKPQVFARRLEDADTELEGDKDMICRLTRSGGLTGVSRRDSLIAAAITLGSALLLAAMLMLVENEMAKTILMVMSPGVFVLGTQWLYTRGHSMAARIGLIGGPFVILFLIGLAAGMFDRAGG